MDFPGQTIRQQKRIAFTTRIGCVGCNWNAGIANYTIFHAHHCTEERDSVIIICPNCHALLHSLFGRKYKGPIGKDAIQFLILYNQTKELMDQVKLVKQYKIIK